MAQTIAAQLPNICPADVAPTWQQRVGLMAINAVLFQTLYSACNAAALRANVTEHVATPWDAAVPFVPWMLLPYITSVPLLMLAFWLTPGRQSLRALSQRCMLATVLATLVFALWPLRVSIERPLPEVPLLAFVSEALKRVDAPFNQWPSLHAAFCVILWPALRPVWSNLLARTLLAAWLILVAASTVLTLQHHLLDLLGGVLLGVAVCAVVPAYRDAPWVSLHYAVMATAALVLGLTQLPLVLCVWLAACCLAVAWAYARRDADFLHKRDGSFPLWVRVLYAPYLVGYWLTWCLVRWRGRGQAPVTLFAPRLWIGRRLDDHEARSLPPGCVVIDLAAELSATPALRCQIPHTFALLDLMPPPADRLTLIVATVDAELARGHTVYLHCAMGIRRSREVAMAWRARHSTRVPA
jgi:membrane-associated phospholipid phosphatase